MRFVFVTSLAALAAALAAPAGAQTDRPWSTQGSLDDSDAQDSDEHRYDDHRIRLEAGRRYRISAESEDFDTYIRLYRAGESDPVAENDDYEGLNSRIAYTPQQSGDYVLRVLAYSPEGRGAYTAAAEAMPPLPAPVSTPDRTVNSSGSWALWQRDLSATDPDLDGRHYDDYLITMRAGETRWIAVNSTAIDPLVAVLPAATPEGDPIDIDDDAGPGVNSLLGFQAEEAGSYIVRVTSYGGGETGAYTLWISQ